MRLTVIFLSFALALLAYTCKKSSSKNAQYKANFSPASLKNITGSDTVIALMDFQKDIQPILKSRCSPCHFPGGKMYSKLPFDSAQTILNHPEGILRRIKDEEENRKIKDFVAQVSK